MKYYFHFRIPHTLLDVPIEVKKNFIKIDSTCAVFDEFQTKKCWVGSIEETVLERYKERTCHYKNDTEKRKEPSCLQ